MGTAAKAARQGGLAVDRSGWRSVEDLSMSKSGSAAGQGLPKRPDLAHNCSPAGKYMGGWVGGWGRAHHPSLSQDCVNGVPAKPSQQQRYAPLGPPLQPLKCRLRRGPLARMLPFQRLRVCALHPLLLPALPHAAQPAPYPHAAATAAAAAGGRGAVCSSKAACLHCGIALMLICTCCCTDCLLLVCDELAEHLQNRGCGRGG